MAKTSVMARGHATLAAADDIKRVLGDLGEAKLLAIMALQPTIIDVEEASLWLTGDSDIFGSGQPLKPVAGDIVAILTADEEDEQRSPS